MRRYSEVSFTQPSDGVHVHQGMVIDAQRRVLYLASPGEGQWAIFVDLCHVKKITKFRITFTKIHFRLKVSFLSEYREFKRSPPPLVHHLLPAHSFLPVRHGQARLDRYGRIRTHGPRDLPDLLESVTILRVRWPPHAHASRCTNAPTHGRTDARTHRRTNAPAAACTNPAA